MPQQRSKRIERLMEGGPTIIMEEGRLLRDRMEKERVDETDILEAARELQGVARLDQIKYAVVEKNGQVTVVPKQGEGS